MTEVTCRPGEPRDAEAIVDFNARMAIETERLTLDRDVLQRGVTKALADPAKGRYLVAEVAGVTLEWSDWRDGQIWWIQSVYVEPAHRGRGVFRRLYEATRAAARHAGAVGLRLYVERDNAAARATYAKLGMGMTHYRVMEEMFSD